MKESMLIFLALEMIMTKYFNMMKILVQSLLIYGHVLKLLPATQNKGIFGYSFFIS